jgi:mxaJ protein
VARGEVDLAIVWGPLAGWFAPRAEKPLEIWPVQPSTDGPYRFSFSMAMGVKKGNGALAQRLDEAIARQQPKIDALLASFRVPAPPP